MYNVPIRVLAKQERFMFKFIKNNGFYVEQFFEFVIDSIGVICRLGCGNNVFCAASAGVPKAVLVA